MLNGATATATRSARDLKLIAQSPSKITMTNHYQSELWQRLRIARDLAGLTQLQLADKMHISRPSVAFWENKNPSTRTQMNSDQLQRYAANVGIPLALILDNTLSCAQFEELARSALNQAPAPREGAPRASNLQAAGQAFFSAVKYGVIERNEALTDCFDVEVRTGALGLVASFATPGHVVQFVIQQTGAVDGGDQLQIIKETGYLLTLERALAATTKGYRNAQKHLILFTPSRAYSMAGREEYEATFGIQLSVGTTIDSAVEYLVNMA